MSIKWLARDQVEDRADRRRQAVLTEFQLGHVPAFRQAFIDHFAVVGRELPETPGWFRGPTGGLYEVVLTGRSGEPVPAGLEVAALPARFVPLVSSEVNQDLWAFLDWLLERVGPPWTPEALGQIGAIYRIPEAEPGFERVASPRLGVASGVLTRRPVLDYPRAGDTLVVTKLDRLGRSVRNLKQIAGDLQRREIGLKALSQGIDTTTTGGRLFFHMLAAIAEFEHDLIVERTVDGLAAARARGRKDGPKFKMTPTKVAQARSMYDTGQHTVQEIADTFGVSRPTVYRHLAEQPAAGRPAK